MTPAATLAEALAPLRDEPGRAAVLLDVDGTLAPIVRHAEDAHVGEATRSLLIRISRRYGTVACVSGRRAADARRIVGIGSIAYVGNHGGEVLEPGTVGPRTVPELQGWARRVQDFARRQDGPELSRLRVRLEDKDAIVAFHWRGATDEDAALEAVRRLAAEAEAAGFGTHWGRKVLEVRPPVSFDKGTGIERLLAGAGLRAAVYAGDDVTDMDAFRGLRAMRERGELGTALCVGVTSDEEPTELAREADLVVQGTDGVRRLLEALAD